MQSFRYNRILRIIPLDIQAKKKIIYNKELKMYFELPESYFSYEIEVQDVQVDITKEFRKAHDFLRRLNYKYDWIQLERCSNGMITEVSNLNEVRDNWIKLKEKIKLSYKGNNVESYLKKISNEFENEKHFEDIFSQYNEYGLLYPPIPEKHDIDWTKERQIKLDSTPDTELKEKISFIDSIENIRRYALTWTKKDTDSLIEIKEGEGIIEYCAFSHTVQKVIVDITFAHDNSVTNYWKFRLEKVDNIIN